MDSMQLYAGFPIASAQPEPEVLAAVPHHLFAVLDLAEDYDSARYVEDARAAAREILAADAVPLFVGGNGLYLKALLEGLAPMPPRDRAVRAEIRAQLEAGEAAALRAELEAGDPESAAQIGVADHHRLERALEILRVSGKPRGWFWAQRTDPAFRATRMVGLRPPRPWLHARLAARLEGMREAGLVAEMRALYRRFGGREPLPTGLQAIGYRSFVKVFEGQQSEDDALAEVLAAHRRMVRRQETWFRKLEGVEWIDPSKGEGEGGSGDEEEPGPSSTG